MTTRVPNPAYPARDSAALYGDKSLYARIGEIAEQEAGRSLIEQFEIPIRSGKAWIVKKGAFILVLSAFGFFFWSGLSYSPMLVVRDRKLQSCL